MIVYVFLIRRFPQDRTSWPAVYTDRELAEKAYGRASEIVEVEVTETTERFKG